MEVIIIHICEKILINLMKKKNWPKLSPGLLLEGDNSSTIFTQVTSWHMAICPDPYQTSQSSCLQQGVVPRIWGHILSIKCLLCKDNNLSSLPTTHIKQKWVRQHLLVLLGEVEPGSLDSKSSLFCECQVSGRAYLKRKGMTPEEKCLRLFPDLQMPSTNEPVPQDCCGDGKHSASISSNLVNTSTLDDRLSLS